MLKLINYWCFATDLDNVMSEVYSSFQNQAEYSKLGAYELLANLRFKRHLQYMLVHCHVNSNVWSFYFGWFTTLMDSINPYFNMVEHVIHVFKVTLNSLERNVQHCTLLMLPWLGCTKYCLDKKEYLSLSHCFMFWSCVERVGLLFPDRWHEKSPGSVHTHWIRPLYYTPCPAKLVHRGLDLFF